MHPEASQNKAVPECLPADLTAGYRRLADETALSPDCGPGLAGRMDQWILDYLDRCDDQGNPLPLPGLLRRVTRFNTWVGTRIIRDQILRLETERDTAPPLPFCWISLGSDARGEQVLRTDQDNALIYADPAPGTEEAVQAYFNALASRVTRELARFGFALCKGGVMADHPEWCRSLGGWLAALDSWVGATDPAGVRKLTILLDFRPVFGDNRLAATLHNRVFENFKLHPAASHFLARDDRLFAPPRTGFNRIRTLKQEGCQKCFNLKTQAITHIVNGARLFAVNHGIRVPATLKRIEQLGEEGVLSSGEARAIAGAFIFLNRMKLLAHLAPGKSRLPANSIDLAKLPAGTRKDLDRALDVVAAFQKKTHAAYNQAWLNFFN